MLNLKIFSKQECLFFLCNNSLLEIRVTFCLYSAMTSRVTVTLYSSRASLCRGAVCDVMVRFATEFFRPSNFRVLHFLRVQNDDAWLPLNLCQCYPRVLTIRRYLRFSWWLLRIDSAHILLHVRGNANVYTWLIIANKTVMHFISRTSIQRLNCRSSLFCFLDQANVAIIQILFSILNIVSFLYLTFFPSALKIESRVCTFPNRERNIAANE